ncbi:hypothetical protein PSTT_16735 [Puccinia striiformis]|uniref:Retrotransposon Copia-like N-terminal domain-containing protein n=3 Tax=Puccinia striiformis TaxID=27350 RepID=A0A2S4UBR1_9BASI|nr:hypothetical protein PSTT_16735 [Puccinia striiformis]
MTTSIRRSLIMSTEAVRESRILLTPTNYAIWFYPMESKLQQISVLLILEDTMDDKSDVEKLALLDSNEKAYHLIISYLSPDVIALMSSAYRSPLRFNGYSLWHFLKSHYAGGDLASQTTALAKFNLMSFTLIAKFIPAICLANQAMNLSGVVLDDRIRVNEMLKKLPGEYQSFRDIITMGEQIESFEIVMRKLENYVAMNNLGHESSSSATLRPAQTAMHTRSDRNNSSGLVCEHCKTPGHRVSNCWKKFPEKAPKSHQAHMTMSDNANQLANQENKGDFSWFCTADGVCHLVDEMRFEGVQYF